MDLQREIVQITEIVCDALLDMKVSVRPSSTSGADAGVARQVRLSGGWNGSVTVECSVPFARRAAGATFAVDPSAASPEQIQDVVGEIANQVGGDLKALLPGPTKLSLPRSGEHDQRAACMVHFAPSSPFDADGEELTVTVVEDDR